MQVCQDKWMQYFRHSLFGMVTAWKQLKSERLKVASLGVLRTTTELLHSPEPNKSLRKKVK